MSVRHYIERSSITFGLELDTKHGRVPMEYVEARCACGFACRGTGQSLSAATAMLEQVFSEHVLEVEQVDKRSDGQP